MFLLSTCYCSNNDVLFQKREPHLSQTKWQRCKAPWANKVKTDSSNSRNSKVRGRWLISCFSFDRSINSISRYRTKSLSRRSHSFKEKHVIGKAYRWMWIRLHYWSISFNHRGYFIIIWIHSNIISFTNCLYLSWEESLKRGYFFRGVL